MGEEKKVREALFNGEELHCTRSSPEGGMCKEKVKCILRFRKDPGDGWGVTLYPRCYAHMQEDKKLAIEIEYPNLSPLK